MRVLHVANYHRLTWGSDKAWEKTIRRSQDAGIETALFSRDSRALSPGLTGKMRAFVGGLYPREAVAAFSQALAEFGPDVVQTHELYPLISPWILKRCTQAGIPVVHTVYDYRLTCPIATHFTRGAVCVECEGGREWRAVVRNCRSNLPESAAYALRNAVARKFRLFHDHVAQFLVLTEYGRRWLIDEVGIPDERITIQPCLIPAPATGVDPAENGYIAYAGRFAWEKGVHVAIAAVREARLPLRLAGNAATHPDIRPGDDIACVPTETPADLARFYRGARLLVVPSIWRETFSVVAAEAMSHGVPVIAARIGALPGTVLDDTTGLLVPPGDVAALATAMRRLWDDPALCRRLGAAGRQRVARDFDTATHIGQLKEAYRKAIASRPAGQARNAAARAAPGAQNCGVPLAEPAAGRGPPRPAPNG